MVPLLRSGKHSRRFCILGISVSLRSTLGSVHRALCCLKRNLGSQSAPLLVLLMGWLCLASPAAGQYSPQQGRLSLLTRIDEIRRLTPEEAALQHPVRLRAVVTYYDPEPPDLFIQDSTEGIWVETTGTKLTVKPGQLVEIEGVTGAPDFAPQVEKPRIRVVGQAPMPVARRVSYERMASSAEDSQWVEVEGIVRFAAATGDRLTLDLATEGGRLQVSILGFTGPAPQKLVDSRVAIHGVCGTLFNKRNQLIGVVLYVPGLSQVKTQEEGPADPFAIPVRPIGSLLRFTPQGGLGHRLRVQGVVALQLMGSSLFIQDGNQGLRVETKQAASVQPGDRVDVVGFPLVGEYTPVLQDAIFRRIEAGPPPNPIPVTAGQALQGDFDAELVELQAQVLSRARQPGLQTLVLQAGNIVFSAGMEDRAPEDSLAFLENESQVQITGVCTIQVDENRNPRVFRILARSPQDLVVLRRPPWWTVGRALTMLGLMGAVILVALGWAEALRRRVLEKTAMIRATLESTADGILALDAQGKIINFNQKFIEIWRIPEQALASHDHSKILEVTQSLLKEPEAFLAKMKEVSAAPDAQVDDTLELKDGRVFERHSEPQRIGGKNMGRVWSFRDVTRRKRAEQTIERRSREASLINEMGTLLQTCLTSDEAYRVIAQYAKELFTSESGALCVLSASRNLVEAVAVWGDSPSGHQVFAPGDCWALRSGRVHFVDNSKSGLVCRHLNKAQPGSYLCVPMMAQGDALGVLHVQISPIGGHPADSAREDLTASKQQLAVSLAEHLALALANLRLRETLRVQSIRDPLTGLFNRRYLEESLERELRRAARNKRTLGTIMLDLDDFKTYNDTFGHEAGDTLLRELGNFLKSNIRGEDIACRYGGEEFALILPEASIEGTRQRAEQLREGVKHLEVQHRGQSLGGVTLSVGVAMFPEHGTTTDDILRAADAALYQAKATGRDRVVIWQTVHKGA
jgi:diguanylate cyclase (GGDEF)-like protein/PAS domain S-box-containing protein